jgi:uncharacterized protein (DUF1800 family)
MIIFKFFVITLFSFILSSCINPIDLFYSDGDSDAISSSTSSSYVALGPISNADIKIYTLSGTQIGSGKTTIYSQNIDTTLINGDRKLNSINGRSVGKFNLTNFDASLLSNDDLVKIVVAGGIDIDPNDDGVVDNNIKQLKGKLYGFVSVADIKNNKVVINALTTIGAATIGTETNSITIKNKLNKLANHYFKSSLDGDSDVDFKELYSYNPSIHNFDNQSTREHDTALRSPKLYEDLLINKGTKISIINQILNNDNGVSDITNLKTEVLKILDDDNSGEVDIFENINHKPIASAGLDIRSGYSKTITIVGNGFDVDNNTLTFSWTQTAGIVQNISNSSPTISVNTGGVDATLTFQLTVNDGFLSATDEVSVFVRDTSFDNAAYKVVKNTHSTKTNLVNLSALNATIYYTLDGSEPTKSSTIYNDIIALNPNSILKFIAVDNSGSINNNLLIIKNYLVSNTTNDDDNDGVSNLTEVTKLLNPLSNNDIFKVSSGMPTGCFSVECSNITKTTKTADVSSDSYVLTGGTVVGNISTSATSKGTITMNISTGEYGFIPIINACNSVSYGELCTTSFEYTTANGLTHNKIIVIDRELEFAPQNSNFIIGTTYNLVVDPDGEPVKFVINTAPIIGSNSFSRSQASYTSAISNQVLQNISDKNSTLSDNIKLTATDISGNILSKTFNITLNLGADSDNGGINDILEDYFGFDKSNSTDDVADKDNDKINNRTEVFYPSNPLVAEVLPQTSDTDKLNFKVMNRLAFGVNSTLTSIIDKIGGINNWVNNQLDNPQTDLDDGTDGVAQSKMDVYHMSHPYRIDVLPTIRPLHSDKQLQSVMARFWDNHFNTDFGKHLWGLAELWDRDQFYLKSLGNFKDLVMLSAKSATMSRYLDGNTNRVGLPNENYAREIMELHTLGVGGGYTDEDIKQLARVFTGWTYMSFGLKTRYEIYFLGNKITTNIYQFKFISSDHDSASDKPFLTTVPDTDNYDDGLGNMGKVIKSQTGEDGVKEGEFAIDVLAKHPTTAKYICSKLTKFLVSDTPLNSTINTCKTSFLENKDANNQIALVVKSIFDTDEFKNISSENRKLKDTQEYILSIGRLLEIDAIKYNSVGSYNSGNIGWNIYNTEQRFFQKPEPTGYPEISDEWNKTNIAFNRIQQSNNILQDNRNGFSKVDLPKFFKSKNLITAKQIIEFILPKTTAGYYDGTFVQKAYDILRPNNKVFDIDNDDGKEKLQELLGFLLSSVEFNLH